MKVTLYCKPTCCWTAGVKEVLQRYNIDYEEVNVSITENFLYMKAKTKQPYSPCLRIDDEWVVDVGGKELETYFNSRGIYTGMME